MECDGRISRQWEKEAEEIISRIKGSSYAPLHRALVEKAKEEGVSLNQLVVYILSMGTGRSKAA